MIVAIADTHTIIWYLFSDTRLGKTGSDFIDSAIAKAITSASRPSALPK